MWHTKIQNVCVNWHTNSLVIQLFNLRKWVRICAWLFVNFSKRKKQRKRTHTKINNKIESELTVVHVSQKLIRKRPTYNSYKIKSTDAINFHLMGLVARLFCLPFHFNIVFFSWIEIFDGIRGFLWWFTLNWLPLLKLEYAHAHETNETFFLRWRILLWTTKVWKHLFCCMLAVVFGLLNSGIFSVR